MILAFSGYLSNLVILGLPNRCHPNMGAGGALLVTEERIPRIEMFKIVYINKICGCRKESLG